MEQRTFDHTRVRVCLDELAYEKLSGRLYNMTLSKPILFHDLGKMMIDVDTLFDEIGSPQSFQERRTFGSTPKKHKMCIRDRDGATKFISKSNIIY